MLELSIPFLSSLANLPIACVPMFHHQQHTESTLEFTLIILYLLNLHCWVVDLSGILSICVTADTLSMLWLWLCRSGKEAFGKEDQSHLSGTALFCTACLSPQHLQTLGSCTERDFLVCYFPPVLVSSLTSSDSSPRLCPLKLLTLLHKTDRFWGPWEGDLEGESCS